MTAECKVNFVICAPSYHELNGGAIVLHKLCHILNTNGFNAFLHPFYGEVIFDGHRNLNFIEKALRVTYRKHFRKYSINPNFKTPVINNTDKLRKKIVIYPEIVIGNPLEEKNVVRWFLCEPGMHNGTISYNKSDLIVDFNSFLNEYEFPGANIWDDSLFITHMPLEYYNLDGALDSSERHGTAYCIRKGKGRTDLNIEDDAILIDGLSHSEVSKIFKRVQTFYSYDLYTAYSPFAALCGADSIVVPDKNISAEQWFPDRSKRFGIGYGCDDIDFARSTRQLLLQSVIERELESIAKAVDFAHYAIKYFEE